MPSRSWSSRTSSELCSKCWVTRAFLVAHSSFDAVLPGSAAANTRQSTRPNVDHDRQLALGGRLGHQASEPVQGSQVSLPEDQVALLGFELVDRPGDFAEVGIRASREE